MGMDIPRALYGIAPEEVHQHVGSLAQVARIDHFTENEGKPRGARRLRLVTGGGLEAEIHPDRALDLGHVTYHGIPMSWISPVGISAPSLAEAHGTEWLRSFGGGLVATCGLDTFGPPSTAGPQEFPMHGRVGITPAIMQEARIVDGRLVVRGEIRQTTVFGENLVLQRLIYAEIGGTSLTLEDVVTNEGPQQAGHMILYHVNIGWPLLSEQAHLKIPSKNVAPRDSNAAAGVARWHEIEPPQGNFQEQVFLHDFTQSPQGVAIIDNPALNIAFTLSFDTNTLPALHQWKMSRTGSYVMGLEPANTQQIQGRFHAQESGALPQIGVGESIRYQMNFHFGPSRSEQK